MPGPDPTHWLHRLTADEWLSAATNELALCEAALARRATRPGVTHARRAAGMALNGLLAHGRDNADWGRSYMEHVAALENDGSVTGTVREAATVLRTTNPAPPELLRIGRPDMNTLEHARVIVAWAQEEFQKDGDVPVDARTS
jgi:hypothetical protein